MNDPRPIPEAAETSSDAACYEKAIAEYGESLARLAAGYELDRARSQDLLQEIHLALWRSLAAFRNQCSLRTWVYRVAHNTASSHVRRQLRARVGRLVSLQELENLAVDGDAEQALDESAIRARLAALIRRLKPIDRDVMLLYLEGMDAAAIGEITGLSPANASQKISRTKKALRSHFLADTR